MCELSVELWIDALLRDTVSGRAAAEVAPSMPTNCWTL